MNRSAEIKRKTKETDISVKIDLDGKGYADINTGIPFMDHMLTLMSFHAFMDMQIKAKGDIEVDYHHTVEDLGICIGMAIKEALKDMSGIKRFGEAIVPMDESLVRTAIDISGRPFLVYNVFPKRNIIKDFDIGLIKEFFYALSMNAKLTVHIDLIRGEDPHHISEAVFKSFARAFDKAKQKEEKAKIPSTKGVL